jgi:prolyl 4-hydroxylase
MILEKEEFFTEEDCKSLIELAQPQLFRTTTLGKPIDGYRVAEGAWLTPTHDVVCKLRCAISDLIGIPEENMEGTHIVKYEVGGEYKVHHDFFHPNEGYYDREVTHRGGQRIKTALVYLNEGFKGGGTEFPQQSTLIIPKTGKLVVWNNTNEDGTLDFTSIHAGLPVEEGTKYIAVIWVRENKFR